VVHFWKLNFNCGITCRNPSFGLATKAKRGCKGEGLREARESHQRLPGVKESVREWAITLPRQLPLWEMESRWTPETSETDLSGQNSMACGVLYIIKKLLEHRCLKWARVAHLDIWNTSYGQKKGPGVELPVWLPIRKCWESTRFTWLQTTCHIPLESSQRELQLCFRPHFDPRSARKVMGRRSPESPGKRDFGTPTWESREWKAIWMQPQWRVTEYTIRGKVVASPKFGPWWVLCVHVARGSS
jgi:hypothetical protein